MAFGLLLDSLIGEDPTGSFILLCQIRQPCPADIYIEVSGADPERWKKEHMACLAHYFQPSEEFFKAQDPCCQPKTKEAPSFWPPEPAGISPKL
ncbi:unnamed protein product [Pieris macdunnoughi]|uniref:Uncharacterized protein n=1 Tax=Pieris macdunnoughi TaxID=345717 RepID=A0A821NB75_9NEOP|nr:unnamed protein product [Pieris macdunnoughi]